MLQENKLKDISKFYNIIDVVGEDIVTSKGKMNIYEVTPCRVMSDSKDIKSNIFNAYLVALKMINIDYQVVISTSNMNFNIILDILNKNMYSTNNVAQKRFIKEYKEYLFDLSKEVQLFNKSFYLVTNKLKQTEECQLKEAFNGMRHIGISIAKITDELRLKRILYESINKINGGLETNEC